MPTYRVRECPKGQPSVVRNFPLWFKRWDHKVGDAFSTFYEQNAFEFDDIKKARMTVIDLNIMYADINQRFMVVACEEDNQCLTT